MSNKKQAFKNFVEKIGFACVFTSALTTYPTLWGKELKGSGGKQVSNSKRKRLNFSAKLIFTTIQKGYKRFIEVI